MKRILLSCLACACLSAVLFAVPSPAPAALAEGQTVLYYLIEMQRRTGRGCDGSTMPGAPSLMPSETLRVLAEESAKGGARATDKNAVPLFTAFCTGATPQQAVQNLMAAHCRDVMSHDWRYIGAYGKNGTWVVVMAARDPDQWIPAEPGQTNQGLTPPADDNAAVSAAATGQRSASRDASAVNAQTSNVPAATPSTGPDMAKNEPVHPAAPVVVGEIEIDALGRPVFPPAGVKPAPVQSGGSGVAPLTDSRQTLSPNYQNLDPAAPGGSTRIQPGTNQGIQSQSSRVVGTAPVRVAGTPPDPMVMLGLVNGVRIKGALCNGVAMPAAPALAPDSKVMAAAGRHAEDMAGRNYFSSLSPEGVTLGQRLTRIGYNWGLLAENIARGSSSPERIVESWLASGEQCRNIMDPQYSHAGIGFAPLGQIWVLTIAAPMAGNDGGLRLR